MSGLFDRPPFKRLYNYYMKHCLAAFLMAAVLLSCVREEILAPETDAAIGTIVDAGDNFVQGEARVFLSEELAGMVEEAAQSGSVVTKSAGLNEALAELGIIELRRLFPHAGEYEERTRAEGLHRGVFCVQGRC